MVQTIFDLGLHIGCDTEFYLRKGFRVIAVEANPSLVHAAGKRFSEYMERGLLHIVDRAITDGPAGEKITLHVRKDKDDWSSIFPDAAERDGAPVQLSKWRRPR